LCKKVSVKELKRGNKFVDDNGEVFTVENVYEYGHLEIVVNTDEGTTIFFSYDEYVELL
jgi:hypothetical protein